MLHIDLTVGFQISIMIFIEKTVYIPKSVNVDITPKILCIIYCIVPITKLNVKNVKPISNSQNIICKHLSGGEDNINIFKSICDFLLEDDILT